MQFRKIAALLLLLFFLAGCSAATSSQQEAATSISVVDDTSRTVELAAPAKRVISLAPSNTEIVFAIGAGDRLVGVTNFCNYPPEAADIEKIGDFFQPNMERILALEPDLVLAAAGIQDNVIADLEKNGIAVAVFDPKSVAAVAADIIKIGKLLGCQNKADEVASSLMKAVSPRPQTGKVVFLEINAEPLMTVGKGTFISDLISRCGYTNAGDSIGDGYPTVNPEVLLEIDPDIYLVSRSLGVTPEDVASRPGFAELKCVKEGRVYVLPDDDVLMRPGPRLEQAYRMIIELCEQ